MNDNIRIKKKIVSDKNAFNEPPKSQEKQQQPYHDFNTKWSQPHEPNIAPSNNQTFPQQPNNHNKKSHLKRNKSNLILGLILIFMGLSMLSSRTPAINIGDNIKNRIQNNIKNKIEKTIENSIHNNIENKIENKIQNSIGNRIQNAIKNKIEKPTRMIIPASVKVNKHISIVGIKNINIQSELGDVSIAGENDMKDLEFVTDNEISTDGLNISKSGNELTIVVDSDFEGFSSENGDLKINLPENYNGSINVISDCGDTNLKNLNLDDLNLENSSGDVNLQNINEDNGKIALESGTFNSYKVNSKKLDVEMESGTAKLDKCNGDLKINSESGDVYIDYDKLDNNIDVNSESGNINLTLPGDSAFRVSANAEYGNIDSEFDINITSDDYSKTAEDTIKSDKNHVELDTESGDIHLNKK